MLRQTYEINFGMHDLDKIDICSSVVGIASKFKCDAYILKHFKDSDGVIQTNQVNLKSILGVTTLLWEHGNVVEILFDGYDEEACAHDIGEFLTVRYSKWHD